MSQYVKRVIGCSFDNSIDNRNLTLLYSAKIGNPLVPARIHKLLLLESGRIYMRGRFKLMWFCAVIDYRMKYAYPPIHAIHFAKTFGIITLSLHFVLLLFCREITSRFCILVLEFLVYFFRSISTHTVTFFIELLGKSQIFALLFRCHSVFWLMIQIIILLFVIRFEYIGFY